MKKTIRLHPSEKNIVESHELDYFVVVRRVNSLGATARWGGLRAYYLCHRVDRIITIVDSSPQFWGSPTQKAINWLNERVGNGVKFI
jgi:hypothetical protein